MKTCMVEDCLDRVVGNGLCGKHYMRMRRKGNTSDVRKNAAGVCSVDGCEEPRAGHGLCRSHYGKQYYLERKKTNPRPVNKYPIKSCLVCGGSFEARPYGSNERKYCSRKCKNRGYYKYGNGYITQRRKNMKKNFGLTLEGFDAMLEVQDGRCAICGTTEPGGRGKFHVDHNHDTGVNRGLLCSKCNVGLGSFGDSADRLEAAASYLRGHSSVG